MEEEMDRHRRFAARWSLPSAVVLALAGLAAVARSAEGPAVDVVIRGPVDVQIRARESRLPVLVAPAADPFEDPEESIEPIPEEPKPTSARLRSASGEPGTLTVESPQPLVSGPSSPLVADAPAVRSESLERIAQEADRQTRRGFELAGRGAYFAARSQFVKALRLVAQGLDTEYRTDRHSRSLAAGLTAIDESADFIPTGSRLEADLDVAAIVEGHRTAVLKDVETEGLSPMLAVKCYFTFAQEQLAVAAGGELAGSMALHAMGKLHVAQSLDAAGSVRAAESKAVAFYQAALLAYPENHMAANDLGVLLARCGHYGEAESALRYSLALYPESTGWHNLTVVYQQLGQEALLRQADQLARAARAAEQRQATAGQPMTQDVVRWVDPSVFGVPSSGGTANPATAAARPASAAAVKTGPVLPPAQPSLGWLPWGTSEERR